MKRSWLIAIRKEKKISQKCISEQIGITQPSYSKMEGGKSDPSVQTAKAIANILGFDWTRFYEDKERPSA